MDREHKLRVAAEDVEAQLARKNDELRRARNALQRELASRTEDVSQLTQELIASKQTLLALREELAAEVTAMTRLHELSTRLLASTELQPLLEEVLDATIALLNADFGNVQLYNRQTGALEIVAHRGFQQEFLDYFNSVHEGTASCGAALQQRERVIVEDVLTDPVFEPHLQIVAAAGYRAVQSTPLFSRGGEPLGMISTHFRQPHRPSERELRLTDLYARQAAEMIEPKQAEEALRKLNERVEMILDSITDNFFAFGKDWRFTYFNKHAEKQLKALGKDPARLIGKVAWEEFQADPAVEEVFRRAMRERAVITHEHYYPPLGEWVENRIYPSPEGGVAVFQRYVTERKLAEGRLRRSEANLAETQRLSHAGSWAWNVSTGELFWSEEHFRICDLDPEKVKPSYSTALQWIHPEDRSFVQQTFERAIRERSDFEQEYRIVRPDGIIKHVHSLGHPVFNESGELTEYVGTIIDITEHKQIEQTLQENQQRLRVALESSAVAFTILRAVRDESGRIIDFEWLYLNPAAWRILGRAPEELIGRRVLEVLPGGWDPPGLFECFVQVVNTGEPRDLDVASAHNGIHGWFHNIATKIGDGVAVWFADVTERRRAEEDLRRSEAFLAEGQRISHTGSWSVKLPSEDVFWSQEVFRIYGLDPATTKLSQQLAFQLIHPEDRLFVKEAFERAVRDKSDYAVEHRAILADGSIKHLHALGHPVLNESGDLIEYVGTVVDITERKRAEANLAESERRFRLLVESIPHHVWSFRPDTSSVGYWNQRLIDYSGLTPEEIKTGGWAALHPDDVERVKAAWEKAWANGEEYEMEQRMRGRDGRYRRFVCRAVAIKDEQGRPIEWFGTNTDVEERRRAEEALHKSQAELAHVSRVTLMGEMAASIAHEINQPLGAIVNNGNVATRLATAENGSLDELVKVLSDIVSDANHASAIIARIRAVMRKTSPEKTSLQLKDVVGDVLVLAQGQLAEHRITVRTELPEGLPRVSGDRVQLQQVLLNLVVNGIEAMNTVADERRVMTIAGERDELDGRPVVLITVRDLGAGFNPEDSERLFDAFYTTKPDGMGMGLRISRSIIEAHGGRLWATSGAGPGATFYCALPAGERDET